MKKTSKVLGAVVCSAALAMSMAVPAFAGSVGNAEAFTAVNGGKTATTTVDAEVAAKVISATVPVKATVAVTKADNNGIREVQCPSSTDYVITNTGAEKIKVKNVVGNNGAMTLGSLGVTGALDPNATAASNSVAAGSATLQMSLSLGGKTADLTNGKDNSGTLGDAVVVNGGSNAILPLTLAGYSACSSSIAEGTTGTAFTIVFTIAAAA